MGYSFTIGEAEIDFDSRSREAYIKLSARGFRSVKNSPRHSGEGTSSCYSSYGGWAEFCKFAGLTDLFFGTRKISDSYKECSGDFHRETPLINEHPGVALLVPEDLVLINSALNIRRCTNFGAIAGYGTDEDFVLARLEWLSFWTDFAIQHCKVPVFKNT